MKHGAVRLQASTVSVRLPLRPDSAVLGPRLRSRPHFSVIATVLGVALLGGGAEGVAARRLAGAAGHWRHVYHLEGTRESTSPTEPRVSLPKVQDIPEVVKVELPEVQPAPTSIQEYCPTRVGGPCPFARDDQLQARLQDTDIWYAATVTSSYDDGTADIRYADGRVAKGIACDDLRKWLDGYTAHEWVQIEWKGYGKWYPGRITAVNVDGSYNIMYKEDGMLEDHVGPERIKKAEDFVAPEIDKSKDPVCKLSGTVDMLQETIDAAHEEVKNFFTEPEEPEGALDGVMELGPPRYTTSPTFDAFPSESAEAAPTEVDDELPEAPAPAPQAGGYAASPAAGPSALDENPAEEAEASPVVPQPGTVSSSRDTELVKNMREEVAGRTEELLQRAQAMGANDSVVEDLVRRLEADQRRVRAPYPPMASGCFEERIHLKRTILNRARLLEESLERERKMNTAEHAGKSKKNVQSLVKTLDKRVGKIREAVEQLEKRSKRLEKQGNYDEELRYEIDRLTGAERKLLGQVRKIDTLDDGYSNGTISDTKLAESIQSLGNTLGDMRQTSDAFGYGVLPLGHKWWRYRWEYSVVEACIVCVLFLIAAFWQKVYDIFLLRYARAMKKTPLSKAANADDLSQPVALVLWRRHFSAVMIVLLLAMMTIWAFARLGIFHVWVSVQYLVTYHIHLPSEPTIYVKLGFDIAMQIVFAMLLFYFLTLQISLCAARNDRDCKNLEEGSDGALMQRPVSEVMIGKFAKTTAEYVVFKARWFQLVGKRCEPLRSPRRSSVGPGAEKVLKMLERQAVLEDAEQEKFRLWFFISQRVKAGAEHTFSFDPTIWLLLFCVFFLFAVLHSVFHVAYVRISIATCVTVLLLFVYIIFVIRRSGDLQPDASGAVIKDPSPATVAGFLQVPLFVLCFVAARLLLSDWMWTYNPLWNLAILAAVTAILVLFAVVLAPLVVTYLIKTSFPPHIDDAAWLVEHTMDDAEVQRLRDMMAEKEGELQRKSLALRQMSESRARPANCIGDTMGRNLSHSRTSPAESSLS